MAGYFDGIFIYSHVVRLLKCRKKQNKKRGKTIIPTLLLCFQKVFFICSCSFFSIIFGFFIWGGALGIDSINYRHFISLTDLTLMSVKLSIRGKICASGTFPHWWQIIFKFIYFFVIKIWICWLLNILYQICCDGTQNNLQFNRIKIEMEHIPISMQLYIHSL